MLPIRIKVLYTPPGTDPEIQPSTGDELQHLLYHPVSSGSENPCVLHFSFIHFPADGHSQTFLSDCIFQQKNEKRIILSQIVSMYLEMLENTDKSKPHVRHISEELYTLKNSLPDGVKKMKDLMDLAKVQVRLFLCLQGS